MWPKSWSTQQRRRLGHPAVESGHSAHIDAPYRDRPGRQNGQLGTHQGGIASRWCGALVMTGSVDEPEQRRAATHVLSALDRRQRDAEAPTGFGSLGRRKMRPHSYRPSPELRSALGLSSRHGGEFVLTPTGRGDLSPRLVTVAVPFHERNELMTKHDLGQVCE